MGSLLSLCGNVHIIHQAARQVPFKNNLENHGTNIKVYHTEKSKHMIYGSGKRLPRAVGIYETRGDTDQWPSDLCTQHETYTTSVKGLL